MSAERPLDVIAQEGPPTDSAALKRVSSGSSHAETHEMLLAAGRSTPKELPQIVAKFKAASLDGARSGKVRLRVYSRACASVASRVLQFQPVPVPMAAASERGPHPFVNRSFINRSPLERWSTASPDSNIDIRAS